MYHVRQENLPFVGSSHEFVGSQQGDVGVSVFLYHGKPGSGPGPHRHPYDEIQFTAETMDLIRLINDVRGNLTHPKTHGHDIYARRRPSIPNLSLIVWLSTSFVTVKRKG